MKTAVYDNLSRQWRELYIDGRWIACIGPKNIEANFVDYQQSQEAKDLLKHGPWKPGQVIGDLEALPPGIQERLAPSNPGSSGDAPQAPAQ